MRHSAPLQDDHASSVPSGLKASAGAAMSKAVPAGGEIVKRAAADRVVRSTWVSCQTEPAAISAHMAAALHGTSWPPIDGDTTLDWSGRSTAALASLSGAFVASGATKRYPRRCSVWM